MGIRLAIEPLPKGTLATMTDKPYDRAQALEALCNAFHTSYTAILEQTTSKPIAAKVAEPAAVATPAAEPAKAKRTRKPAAEPAKVAEPATEPAAALESAEPHSAARILLSERMPLALHRAAAKSWSDIERLVWNWTASSDAPQTYVVTFSGSYAERSAKWLTRWLDLQPEVRSYRYVGKTESGVFAVALKLRTSVEVPFED